MNSALPAYEPGTRRVQPVPCAGAGQCAEYGSITIPHGAKRGRYGRCPHCHEMRRVQDTAELYQHLEPFRLVLHRVDPADPAGATLDPLHPVELPAVAGAVFSTLAWDDEGRPRVTWHGGHLHTATTHALEPRLRRRIQEHLAWTEATTFEADIVELVLASQAWALPQITEVAA